MANEIAFVLTSGTPYAVFLDAAGKAYNGGVSTETIVDSHWQTYAVAMLQQGTASGIWECSVPGALGAGAYSVLVYKQAGGTPAVGDVLLGSAPMQWTGTALVTFPANFAALSIGGGKVAATVAAGDSADAATLVGRIPGTVQPQTGDAYARVGSAGAGLTALGDARLANLDAAVSTRSTYAGADTSGTTTLLSRLTSGRATNLDNLDAAVSTRSTYAGGAVASVTGAVGSVTGSVGSVTGSVGSVTAAVTLDLTPAIPVRTQDGRTAPTLADAFLGAWHSAFGAEAEVGTAYRKLSPADGTTIIRAFVLDSSTSPMARA